MDEDTIDLLQEASANLRSIANSITPSNAAAGKDCCGGSVDSLTEAVMGITSGLCEVASALREIAEAIRDKE